MNVFSVRTSERQQFIDITAKVQNCISETNFQDGLVCIFIPHTTAGVTINENADPDVVHDVINTLTKIIPENAGYRHIEGNSDSHVKTSLIAPSITVIVENGKLQLGTWQSIYFTEFDGPRNRQCWVKMI